MENEFRATDLVLNKRPFITYLDLIIPLKYFVVQRRSVQGAAIHSKYQDPNSRLNPEQFE